MESNFSSARQAADKPPVVYDDPYPAAQSRRSEKSPVTYNSYPAIKPGRVGKDTDYTSEGVSDHDIFSLPKSDYQLLGLLTLVTAVVRLFRIYQPNSVVFDEVQ